MKFSKDIVEQVLCQYFTEDLINSLIEQMTNAQAEAEDVEGYMWQYDDTDSVAMEVSNHE